jgi:hypothetical protein
MEAPPPTTIPASDVWAQFAAQCNMEAPAPIAPAPDDDTDAAQQVTALPETEEASAANWPDPGQQVAALPEIWALFAEHGGDLVEAWRLTRVCKASAVGVKGWLGTLPGLVVCGGQTRG